MVFKAMQPIRDLISMRKTTSSISNVIQNYIQGMQSEIENASCLHNVGMSDLRVLCSSSDDNVTCAIILPSAAASLGVLQVLGIILSSESQTVVSGERRCSVHGHRNSSIRCEG